MATFDEFKNLATSEKIILAQIDSAERVRKWELDSGSIYVADIDAIQAIKVKDSSSTYTEVASKAAIVSPGQWFFDKEAGKLYVHATGGVDPDTLFVVLTKRHFFSNVSLHAARDLSTGNDVHWLPLIQKVSEFRMGLDFQNQIGTAIEGSGTISLVNDLEFWQPIYDELTFENQAVSIYVWNRSLDISDAKLFFKGSVQRRSYSARTINFSVRDQFNALRNPLSLSTIGDFGGAIIPTEFESYFQRRLYGRVKGHLPTNVDHVLQEGRTITGTVSLTSGSTTMTGSGTVFLSEFLQGDEVEVQLAFGVLRFTIDTIASDTSLTLSTASVTDITSGTARVVPKRASRNYNRSFVLAGHALREPTTTVTSAASSTLITVADATDIIVGDTLLILGQISTVSNVVGNTIKLNESLISTPAFGSAVTNLTVSNVYLGQDRLSFTDDYTYSASAGTLTLTPLAEFNVAREEVLAGTSVTFTSSSRDVTGVGTSFKSDLEPGDWIRLSSESDFFQISQIDSDTALKLTAASTYSGTGTALFKSPEYYEEGSTKLTCDVLGTTDDDTSSGTLLSRASEIVEDLLKRAGLAGELVASTFADALDKEQKQVSAVIPARFSDKKLPVVRDTIDDLNKSVFGALIQNNEFKFEYALLSPVKSTDLPLFEESDSLRFGIRSKGDKIVGNVNVDYNSKEHDFQSNRSSSQIATASRLEATSLVGSSKKLDVDTRVINSTDADIIAKRYAFLNSQMSSQITISTKLKAIDLNVNDKVKVSNRFLYNSKGLGLKQKVAAIQSIRRGAMSVTMELEDLANSYTKCGVITENTQAEFSGSTDDEKLVNGYITSNDGLILGDKTTSGLNLIF